MKTKVYIDGSEGTTGLRIHERLAGREDIELLTIDPALRKDAAARAERINASDITFLCLPDAAAREAVALATGEHVRIIDASTAHRTAPGWAYGFPELSAQRRRAICEGKRVANPGCHATGFISIVHPLVQGGLLPPDAALSCFSLTGYSGGGKKMIAQYEDDARDAELDAPRPYGLTQRHKHLPEMQTVCGLTAAPIFTPIVADYYAGMLVGVPLHAGQLAPGTTLARLRECLCDAYAGARLVRVAPGDAQTSGNGFLCGNALAGRDDLVLYVTGNEERMTVFSQFDNLGKGASGAAIQSMNLMIGCDETRGLNV